LTIRLANINSMEDKTTSELLVVGPGELGARVATLWKSKFPEAKITLKANREDHEREAKWESLGFIPYKDSQQKYQNVLFAAPPGGDHRSYVNEIKNALTKFSSPSGLFVFTSSGGVYTENSGKMVDENSDVVSVEEPWTTRSQGIIYAEKLVREHTGGIVLRFGGLYTLVRGAHNFWLSGKIKESTSNPNGLINLIHYDDAAEVIMCAFDEAATKLEGIKQEVFLVADGQPTSRIDICKAAKKNNVYNQASIPNFTGGVPNEGEDVSSQIDGKRYNVNKVQTKLQWTPKFSSFSKFMSTDFANEMSVPLMMPSKL